MVDIVTDSCADLSSELIHQFNVRVLPLQVFIDNRTISDGSISPKELFSLVAKTGELPKTSAPSIKEFLEFFEPSDEIIYIGISAKLSATLSNSLLAAQQLPHKKIYIIDSKNLSTGIGLLVLKAAELRDQGWTAEEIVREIRAMVPRVHTSFVIETMEYLYKGGRCTALQAIVGSVLRIRPIIEVRPDGMLGVKAKIRGTRVKALDAMLEDLRLHLPYLDLHRVFVTHTGCDEDAAYLVESIKSMAPVEEICVTQAGATISSHCGPDTIGILFIADAHSNTEA
ncbi:DegV family protein [uncultured Thermanaerothrix sp.]|uniref:DegV family protein n=1 Tax=uncultured Thermanaerothrix sp. TaxID=1195149 RepID=UPI002635447D|nr:DegV family protein [uncultured Thermanaerothrix sp.]